MAVLLLRTKQLAILTIHVNVLVACEGTEVFSELVAVIVSLSLVYAHLPRRIPDHQLLTIYRRRLTQFSNLPQACAILPPPPLQPYLMMIAPQSAGIHLPLLGQHGRWWLTAELVRVAADLVYRRVTIQLYRPYLLPLFKIGPQIYHLLAASTKILAYYSFHNLHFLLFLRVERSFYLVQFSHFLPIEKCPLDVPGVLLIQFLNDILQFLLTIRPHLRHQSISFSYILPILAAKSLLSRLRFQLAIRIYFFECRRHVLLCRGCFWDLWSGFLS